MHLPALLPAWRRVLMFYWKTTCTNNIKIPLRRVQDQELSSEVMTEQLDLL